MLLSVLAACNSIRYTKTHNSHISIFADDYSSFQDVLESIVLLYYHLQCNGYYHNHNFTWKKSQKKRVKELETLALEEPADDEYDYESENEIVAAASLLREFHDEDEDDVDSELSGIAEEGFRKRKRKERRGKKGRKGKKRRKGKKANKNELTGKLEDSCLRGTSR